MAVPAGFEPGITGLKILRPVQLDEGTMSARLTGRFLIKQLLGSGNVPEEQGSHPPSH